MMEFLKCVDGKISPLCEDRSVFERTLTFYMEGEILMLGVELKQVMLIYDLRFKTEDYLEDIIEKVYDFYKGKCRLIEKVKLNRILLVI